MIRLLALAVFFALALPGPMLWAAGPISTSPATISVNPGGVSAVTIRWRVGVTASAPGPVTVTSPVGEVRVDGVTVAQLGRLSRTVRHSGAGTQFVTFTERLTIDRTSALRIAEGATGTYERTFTDASGAATARVPLRASPGGGLTFRNFDLQFDDATRFRVVAQGAALVARLRVTSAGSGTLQGVWEVAGPTATRGDGWRPIGRVRQVLAGSRMTVFESPALPTREPGIYRVRFVPDGRQGRDVPATLDTLQYTVTARRGPAVLDLLSPRAGAPLSPATEFRWASVPGASAYRVEFFAGGGGTPRLAAVDTRQSHASLRPPALVRLSRSDPVLWRVTAYGDDGRPLAVSPIRRLDGGMAARPAR